jgi:pyruvate formate lyase activating enzyme
MNAPLIPINSGMAINLQIIKERVLENIDLLDSIGATGGEPGLQQEPIIELFSWAKGRGIKTFLNTNGSNSKLIDELLSKSLLDHIAVDVKAPLRHNVYGNVIGLKDGIERIITEIRKSLEICRKSSLSVEIRTTVVPTLIEDERSIREIARLVKDYGTYVIQQYFPFKEVLDERLRRVHPPNRARLAKLALSSIEEGVKEVYIRTREHGMERIE